MSPFFFQGGRTTHLKKEGLLETTENKTSENEFFPNKKPMASTSKASLRESNPDDSDSTRASNASVKKSHLASKTRTKMSAASVLPNGAKEPRKIGYNV